MQYSKVKLNLSPWGRIGSLANTETLVARSLDCFSILISTKSKLLKTGPDILIDVLSELKDQYYKSTSQYKIIELAETVIVS